MKSKRLQIGMKLCSVLLKPFPTAKPIIFTLIVLLYPYPLAQTQPEGLMIEDRCAVEGQLPVNPGRNYSDNLSCPSLFQGGGLVPLRCFSRSELCNGVAFCADSAIDEGTSVWDMFGVLDCAGTISGRGFPTYICANENTMINISALCDGYADCSDASDEINYLCESTCLLPYYGGCPYTRVCMSAKSSPVCGLCSPGYVQDRVGRCIPLSCDVLLTDNGLIIYSQQSEDVVIASYFCDDGYILNVTEDRHELTCQANGVWSGFEPSCIGCGNLNVDNGIALYRRSPLAINATYICNRGYEVSGDELRICNLESGIWNGNDSTCKLVDCGPLPHPAHGTVQYVRSIYGSEATYNCNDTYVLLGENPRTCQVNGEWSELEPLCELITVGFGRESYTVTEDADSALICVDLNLNSTFRLPIVRINLQLYTSEGTADETDHARRERDDPNSVIILDDNRRSDCIAIPIIDDKRYEQDEKFVVNLEIIGVVPDTYDVFLSSNSTTVTILANDVIFPFGDAESDARLSNVTSRSLDDTFSPTINLSFTFFSETETVLYVNANGLLSFREEHIVANIRSFQSQDLPSIPLIAPFWADVNIEQGGEIFYRQTDSPMSLQHAVDLLQAAQVSSDVKRNFRPTNVFIATWDRVVGFAVDTDLRNTFQVALAVDGSNSFIFFIYNQLEWLQGPINIGFKNSNGSQSFMLTETTNEDDVQELRLLETSNVGVPGLYLYQVDESSKLEPKILEAETDKPNHMLEYNIGLNNNFCLEDVQEKVNFTIHCNSVQNFVPHSVEWTYDHGIVLDLNQHESNNIIQFENGRYSLAFGPASLSDIISTLNVSDESTSLVVSCQLLNDFGEDAASIQISKCAPTVCQDGVTNNCNQLCSRDNSGVHQCACEEGYVLGSDAATCELINCGQPSSPINGMVNVTTTTITSLAFYYCDEGFRLSGEDTRVCQASGFWRERDPTCEDIDECAEGRCGENVECTNTEGSFECNCLTGFEKNGTTCDDVNECELATLGCSNSAECVNVPGTYTCVCSAGYQLNGDGVSCQVHSAIIATAVCVAIIHVIAIAIIIVVMCLIYRRKNRAKADRKLATAVYDLAKNEREESSIAYVQGRGMELKQSSLIVQNVDDIVKDIHRELLIYTVNLKILESIGQGEFGVVYKGHLLKDLGQTVIGVVAIKTLKGFFDKTLVDELLKECLKMQQFNHPNVLTLTGVCLDGGSTPFLVMPFMANGSLVSYLRKERQNLVIPTNSSADDSEEIKSIALKRLVDMCFQVAKGMEYLSSKRFIHRDLAARNCMIDMNFVIKVADFGLSEQLETKDYFRQDKGEAIKLPVKWLAPESLMDYVFSEKSDVWAYGVTCWEIFSGGKVPYVGLKPTELLSKLESGYRMEKPTNAACSDEIYELVMLQCWKASSAERPTFSNLVKMLSQSLELMAGYLHIGAFDQQETQTSLSSGSELQQSNSVDLN